MGKKIAVVSDIHSNLEALRAVLEDIRQQKVDAIYCLGDVIGYGPNPSECLEEACNRFDFVLLGNHEEAVLAGAFCFHPAAKEAIDWTRNRLKPKWYSMSEKKRLWEWLKSMPLSCVEDDILFVHGSPRDPTMEYILKSDTDDLFGDVPEKIKEIFEQIDRVCFVGHSHTPGIITEDSKWYSPSDIEGVWEYRNGGRIVCNVGSVGQPRDKDPRACYVTYTEREIFYHRVGYEVSKTQEKIRKIPQLDNRNADRLANGS